MDYSTWTMLQLKTRFVELAEQITPLANERREIHDEIEKRVRLAKAAVRFQALTQDQKDALREAVNR